MNRGKKKPEKCFTNLTQYSQGHKIFIVLFVCFFFFVHTVHLQFFKKSYTHIWEKIWALNPIAKEKGLRNNEFAVLDKRV